jgi:hypothetical protein
VLKHLPDALQPVITFAYRTGWRIDSEVLPLEWRQVDRKAGDHRAQDTIGVRAIQYRVRRRSEAGGSRLDADGYTNGDTSSATNEKKTQTS